MASLRPFQESLVRTVPARLPAHVVQQLLEVQLHGGKGAVIAVPGNQGNGLLAAVQLVVIGVKAVDDGLQGGVNPVVVQGGYLNDQVGLDQLGQDLVFHHVIRADGDFHPRALVLQLRRLNSLARRPASKR